MCHKIAWGRIHDRLSISHLPSLSHLTIFKAFAQDEGD